MQHIMYSCVSGNFVEKSAGNNTAVWFVGLQQYIADSTANIIFKISQTGPHDSGTPSKYRVPSHFIPHSIPF